MSAGLRTWGADGAPQLDETSFTVRFVYTTLISRGPPNISGSTNVFVAIAGVSPSTHSAICLPVGAYPKDPNAQDSYAVQFEPQVVAGGVYVWFVNRAAGDSTRALGTQRLLVMRYR